MSIRSPRWRSILWLTAGAMAAVLCAPLLMPSSSNRQDDIDRINSAAKVFNEIMRTPDKGIPRAVLSGAHCLVIIPSEKSAAFTFGGRYGKGIATCRNESETAWNPPLFVTIGGASWGLQIGVQATDVVMVVRSRNGMNSLLSSKFRIGGSASAAAGPVGRDIAADTDIKFNAEILTYSRAKGLFAGVDLNGAVLQPDDTGNAALYGNVTSKTILDGAVPTPPAAMPLIRALEGNPTTMPSLREPKSPDTR